jgi:SAM-dependent methyltransferase
VNEGLFDYDNWRPHSDWSHAERGDDEYDRIDYHVDLGCGTLKKGRIGIDRFPAPGVNIVMNFETLEVKAIPHMPGDDANKQGPMRRRLPFEDNSIESVISHHLLEHIGPGFIPLVDEVYRVLKPGGIFYAITPLFPSRTAVEDPDHKRYIMEGTWETFQGRPDVAHWHSAFSVPYTGARFTITYKKATPPLPLADQWGPDDARELRVGMRAEK